MALTKEDLQAISHILDEKMEPLNQRMDRIEQRMDRMEQRGFRIKFGNISAGCRKTKKSAAPEYIFWRGCSLVCQTATF